MVNINNLFDFCDNSIICDDTIFRIGNSLGNTLLLLAIKNNNNHIYKYSNEWLYLINNYYPGHDYYHSLINISLLEFLFLNNDHQLPYLFQHILNHVY